MTEESKHTALPLALLAGDGDQATGPIERLLVEHGYAALRAPTGRAALLRARGTHPDVVVADAELPDMLAADLCGALRLEPLIAASTPIFVASSTTPSRPERLAVLRAGAWDWLAPPLDAEEVHLRIEASVRAKLDADRARAEGMLDPATGLYNWHGLARRARELGSQAYRQRAALACVSLALDLDPEVASAGDRAAAAVVRCLQTLKASSRVSDAIGRLGPTEFAVLAPATDESGARKLAERLVRGLETTVAEMGQQPVVARVRAGYEAVSNVKYAPVEPGELLARASAALRRGRADLGSAATPGAPRRPTVDRHDAPPH